ncbi:hypothetical protein ACFE04_002609 [Oxalis oulophora]
MKTDIMQAEEIVVVALWDDMNICLAFLLFFGLIDCFGVVALVDTLVAKTRTWEEDRDMSFSYDGVPLLAMLDEYAMLRQERDEENRRMKDIAWLGVYTHSTCPIIAHMCSDGVFKHVSLPLG